MLKEKGAHDYSSKSTESPLRMSFLATDTNGYMDSHTQKGLPVGTPSPKNQSLKLRGDGKSYGDGAGVRSTGGTPTTHYPKNYVPKTPGSTKGG